MIRERLDRSVGAAAARGMLSWANGDLICQMPIETVDMVTGPQIQAAIHRLTDAGCMPAPCSVDELSAPPVFRWNDVGKVTYPWEWPAEGWRAAATVGLRALRTLKELNLTLRLRPLDLFMAGPRPILANLGALARWQPDLEASSIETIERYYVRPLRCAAAGHAELARKVMRGGAHGMSASEADAICGHRDGDTGAHDTPTWLKQVSIPGSDAWTHWDAYEDNTCKESSDEVVAKLAVVQSVLARIKPATILDIGSNAGRYAFLPDAGTASVTGLDSDEECMNIFFRRAADSGRHASAVVMDVCDPSERRGWGRGWCLPAEQRLSSELVMVMALVHHLVLHMHMAQSELTHLLSSLTERWLLLEYAPPRGPYAWASDFFTVDWLLGVLGDHFLQREAWRYGSRGRSLILLQRL